MTDVRLAVRDDLRAIGATLSEAFYDDPVVSYIVPNDNVRRRRGPILHRVNARATQSKGEVWTTADRAGAALWAAPGRWKDTPRQMLQQAPGFAATWRTLPRALRFFNLLQAHHPREPHWYLAVLGTHPAHQGRGIGSALVRPVLDRCDREGVPAYLESSKESNIPFYERHGFELMDEQLRIPGGPTLYPMWRNPQG